MNIRFLLREIWGSRRQALIFMLCTALSIAMLVAVASFSRDIERSVTGDGRALHGGDIIIRSNYPLDERLKQGGRKLQPDPLQRVSIHQFYSVVRGENDHSLFSEILAVGSGYPLYGSVELESGRRFGQQLKRGGALVDPALLQRLELKVGDILNVGNLKMVVLDTITAETSRPVQIVNFGPRIIIHEDDLDATGLIKMGSRVRYGLNVKLDQGTDIDQAVTILKEGSAGGRESVESYRTARSPLKRFFDNLLFFISLIALFTFLLAGAGMQSSLSALLQRRVKSLAIIRTLGGSSTFLVLHYLALVLIYGSVGSLVGICFGLLLKSAFPVFSGGLVGADMLSLLSPQDVISGLAMGYGSILFFTFLPLYRLKEVKPNAVFRSENGSGNRGASYFLFMAGGFLLLACIVILQLDDVRFGLYFLGAVVVLLLVVGGAARGIMILLGKVRGAPLTVRLALRSLVRPGNRNSAVIVTLGGALAVMMVIYLVRTNLQATFVDSYPADAPNVFIVDIQKGQSESVNDLVGSELELHPIVRARLRSINGEPVQGPERQRFRDSLTRPFNLTYREGLLADEVVEQGGSLFGKRALTGGVAPVSVLDSVAEMGDLKIGDILEFNIQGVPLKTEVTSIRSRTRSMLYPFFYFVFPPHVLESAPQTFFGAVHLEEGRVGALQGEIVKHHPNVSVINLARTAAELGEVMARLAGIINLLALFSILAGTLILVSSIVATRFARMREAVYYKVLGGTSRFVFSVFLAENLIIGGVSSVFGILLGQAGAMAICRNYLDIGFEPHWVSAAFLAGATLFMVSLIGVMGSYRIIRLKPAQFLREQSVE